MAKTPKQLLEELKNSQLGGAQSTTNLQPTNPVPANLKLDTSKPTTSINQDVNTPVKLPQPEYSNTVGNTSTGTLNLPDGKTFVGITNKDAQNFTNRWQQEQNPVNGALPIGTAQNEANRQARLQQLMQTGTLSSQELQAIQEAPIDWGQALTAGVANVIPQAAGGAAIGAAAGLATGGALSAPGAVIGGVAGLVTGMFTGIRSNIKQQQNGNIAATKDVLAAARTNMKALSMIVSKDPSQAEEAINEYYNQLAQVQRAQRKLQQETSGSLNKFMEDGTQDLSDFELFLQPGGYADLQLIRLQTAVAKAQPASDEELLALYQEEYSNAE